MAAKKSPLQNEGSKLSLADLQENLNRMEKILNNSNLQKQLSDGGARIMVKRDSLKKELQIRKEMDQIEAQMGQLTLGYSDPHVAKLCSMEKPPKQRFVLNKENKATSSDTMLIDLGASLDLQKAQGEREKHAKDLKILKEYVVPLDEEDISQEDDSDPDSSGNSTHASSDSESEAADTQGTKEDDSGPS